MLLQIKLVTHFCWKIVGTQYFTVHLLQLLPATLAMEKKKEIITCQPRICSFLCSLARYVGSLFPLVLIYTTRATLMTLMKFISSTCYTQYYRKVYIQCQIRTLEHAIRGKTINRLFLFFSSCFACECHIGHLDKHKSKVIGNLPTGLSIMYQLYFQWT